MLERESLEKAKAKARLMAKAWKSKTIENANEDRGYDNELNIDDMAPDEYVLQVEKTGIGGDTMETSNESKVDGTSKKIDVTEENGHKYHPTNVENRLADVQFEEQYSGGCFRSLIRRFLNFFRAVRKMFCS